MTNPKTIAQEKYASLFFDAESKAAAFDKIAELYYFGNFGSTSKADFDVLMFSLYLEQILNQSEDDIWSYSDYKLSKLLGITQQKVGSLKVKKELKYPYKQFDWRESFRRICKKAQYIDGRIRLNIPDRNLFLEIKNAVEEQGGYLEMQLNSSLLVIHPEFFVDLMLCVQECEDKKKLKKEICQELRKHSVSTVDFDKKGFGALCREKNWGTEILCCILELIPSVGSLVADFVRNAA